MTNLKQLLSAIWLPLFALAALASFYAFWLLLDLPPKDEVIRIAQVYFEQYGLITVFVSAIIEGVLLFGWYFPGSLVIVLGVVFAGRDIPQLLGVYAATTLGFYVAYAANYYIGKYGWYRLLSALGFRESLEKAQSQLLKYGPRAVFLTYWHPNLAALTATAAGILDMPFKTFIAHSIVAAALWDAVWTVIGYTLGEASIDAIGPKFVVAFICAWIVLILSMKYWNERLVLGESKNIV
ncbi:VTT domain-containing protein [Candidatus Kaiserbacteria bacterium]|nr:VTT domain-containing protein [Candidatus Kaiserbacteria bacterium]